jgi:hypothetical protein
MTDLANRAASRRVTERRRTAERRSHVLFSDWRWACHGRRTAPRRGGEHAELGVDRYDLWLGVIVIGILLFSAADAALTLSLVQAGLARELNPLMRALIDHDFQIFVNLKLALTAAGLLFMVVCSDLRLFRLIRVRQILRVLLIGYAGLVAYELARLGSTTL